ncbi:P-loop containing nucleoside triphosphate hydrolase protein [Mycena metata]|uniref:P-loop containing nucleoside triphosphate hydrolase protein n=1 Tax=Mycena metata TaxID=1033252 RepID=A0AAD7JE35_9AGAR|nr:P-loop containing nucleoside triphosphate hydrolase protein [Mycena metata]
MEQIYGVIHAIINLHLEPATGGTLPPLTLKHMGQFTETLHRLHTFITEQQEGNKIKQFFRQSEMAILLKDCQKGMQQAMKMFKVEAGSTVLTDIAKMQKASEDMHLKLLEMISTLSDRTASDNSSSMYHMANDSDKSSNSFSMLPSKPKIFYGRESELDHVVKVLKKDSARLAILGAGGIGKTSLARAALHHPDVMRKYELRVFVACDSVTSSIGVAALIGSYLGLKPGQDLRTSVFQHFSSTPSSLLILDNLESSWEFQESRSGVEEFLSLLTDIEHLGLLITMRGAERPGKVSWTHPFLAPLQPLPNDAARQTFFDIADNIHDAEDIDRILGFTDNLPLAVDLMAHLVDHEGSSSVLRRWELEKTTMLSVGYDQRSNLDMSITISLSSPRITALPGATELLSLLSILPDGLSDVQLLQTGLPIHDPLRCKAALLRTALAYNDDKKRLKSLVPIREHAFLCTP